MTEVYRPPLYFAWRFEHNLPYLVHFYITESARSFKVSLDAVGFMQQYFRQMGFTRILVNARNEDARIQKAIEHHFRVRPYGEADGHQFYLVEV